MTSQWKQGPTVDRVSQCHAAQTIGIAGLRGDLDGLIGFGNDRRVFQPGVDRPGVRFVGRVPGSRGAVSHGLIENDGFRQLVVIELEPELGSSRNPLGPE